MSTNFGSKINLYKPVVALGLSPTGDIEPITVNSSGVISIEDVTDFDASYVFGRTNNTVASTVTVQRTYGGVTKTRTIAYNSIGETLSISAFV